MRKTKGSAERRGRARADVGATVTVESTGRCVGAYTCDNVSASGVLLRGPHALDRGERVALRLTLPGAPPLEIEGRVLRVDPATAEIAAGYAVAFDELSADVEDMIHSAVLRSLERTHRQTSARARVIVLYELEFTRRALERDVRLLGYEPVAAVHPDEVWSLLEDKSQDFAAVVIDGHLEAEQRVALLDRLSDDRPDTRRVIVSGMKRASLPHLAVASGRAHAAVGQPWTLEGLETALRG